jgi:Fur family ferric uptake transcriptional regulator
MPQKTRRVNADYLARALEQFHTELLARRMRISKVRDAIACCALQQTEAFSIVELVYQLRNQGIEDAHMATVYRIVPLLRDAGLVRGVRKQLDDSQRYEVAFERETHAQLRCSSCHKTTEVRAKALDALQQVMVRRFNFQLNAGASRLTGVCGRCQRRAHH